MKTKNIFSKIFIYVSIIIALFFNKIIFSEEINIDFKIYLNKSLNKLHNGQDMYEEDKVLQEIYIVGDSL